MADDRLIVEATIDPLRAADLLREVDGVTRLRDGIDLEPTPGHTPGHQSVWVSSGADTLLLTGDVLVHAVQLVVARGRVRRRGRPGRRRGHPRAGLRRGAAARRTARDRAPDRGFVDLG